MTSTVTCPSCGAQTSGKFCAECGQPLGERKCPKCGAKLSARAKFCPECGTTVAAGAAKGGAPAAAGAARGLGDKFPWIIAGLAVLALVAVIIVLIAKKDGPGAEQATADGQFDPNRGTTDITNMSAREAADRLFDRTARAASAGDSQQVQFFGPMTIQAYGNVTPLDADARLHMGLVYLNLGHTDSALAQADSIARGSRTHLFGPALRAQAATQAGNAAAARRAYQDFQRNYDAEIAKNLPEYQQHMQLLNEVRGAAGGGSTPQ